MSIFFCSFFGKKKMLRSVSLIAKFFATITTHCLRHKQKSIMTRTLDCGILKYQQRSSV